METLPGKHIFLRVSINDVTAREGFNYFVTLVISLFTKKCDSEGGVNFVKNCVTSFMDDILSVLVIQ